MSLVPGSQEPVDLAVIGGGVFGLSVARAAVSRGLSVAVFEQGEVGGATSANSHCIIHSGIRYLQRASLNKVIDSARALAVWRREFPEEVVHLPCWMPVWRKWGLKGAAALGAGHLLYRATLALAGESGTQWPGVVTQSRIPDHPLIRRPGVIAAFGWYDGWLRSHGGVVEKLRGAIVAGEGTIRERCSVARVTRAARDFFIETSDGAAVVSRAVVDARGPWVRQSVGEVMATVDRSWCLGFNVLLSRDISGGMGIAVPTGSGRMLFVAPRNSSQANQGSDSVTHRQGLSAIGTGYLPMTGDTIPLVREEDIAAMLSEINDAAKAGGNWSESLSLGDVVGIEIGVLPRDDRVVSEVIADPTTRIIGDGRYIVIESGKYTTAPVFGERIAALVVRELGR